ncbi:uncharacterized protein LOC121640469 [Melanotaenia boesemani]|uniref:uncharacterized protein LOC121640469 n=1 Tax=Melanotaenia boesemani TaxID=1250792 RepID=UPI001C05123B|nr:uncharacterized protein LOC121640469 [Melanotaenia boesemani]
MMANLTSEMLLPPNSVRSLQMYPFARRTMEEKVQVKELGPDKPDLVISQQTKEKSKVYKRSFCRSWFERKSWLTGCGVANALFCFPCLLFKSDKCDLTWTQSGQTDLKHLSERIKKHERSSLHMENCIKLAVLGKISIAAQLDDGHRVAVRRHNEEVDKNRHILSKLIDCIKFCGAFELALRGHDERDSSENPGIFRGLVDLMASIDRDLNDHLESRAVNTVYEHKADLLMCCETIRNSAEFDSPTKREAGGYVRMLEDDAFCFFLALFHQIMPHVDMLYNQLQKRNIDSVYISEIIQRFIESMQAIREAVPSLAEGQEDRRPEHEPPTKKRKNIGTRPAAPFGN